MNYYFSISRVTGDARQDGGDTVPALECGESEDGGGELPREEAGVESWAWNFPAKSQWESRWWRGDGGDGF